MCEADSVLAYEGAVQQAAQDAESAAAAAAAEQEDEADAFQPTKCNVAFGSAHDGWAFRCGTGCGAWVVLCVEDKASSIVFLSVRSGAFMLC